MIKFFRTNWKNIIVIFLFTGICIFLHQFAPDPKKEGVPVSIFYKQGIFGPIIAVDLLVTFSLLAIIFNLIKDKISGTKYTIGLKFGAAFSILWMLGFLEGVLYYGTSLKHDILHGLADGISITLMFFVLGLLENRSIKKSGSKINFSAPAIITGFYFLGRYFLYIVLNIDSNVHTQPVEIFIWTVGIGLSIGYIYHTASESLSGYSPFKKAVWFGVIIFGVNWLLFYSFVPIIQQVSLFNNFIRPITDILFVCSGVFLYEKILKSKLNYKK
ncbi:MAG: hypothetical protein K8R54_11255 [Bacteroidales bacterium]|nr:hypothetical protein [Bacteroidales bacterium]